MNNTETTFNEGDKVTYTSPNFDKKEFGIIKSISDDGVVYVVYHCNNDWNNYKNYTGVNTDPKYLTKDWK